MLLKRFFSIACISLLTGSMAVANAQTLTAPTVAQAQIQVNGTGTVEVVPDTYTVTFVLEQKGATLTKLNSQLQHDLGQLSRFLLDEGVAAEHIASMQVRLNPWYESGPQGREEKGFVLSREVTVVHNDLDHYDRIIDGALKRGVTRISQFELGTENQQKAYQQALINAVKDAKSRAGLLAQELGASVGPVITISEHHSGIVMAAGRSKMMLAESGPAMPGQQHIEATVSATFALEHQ